MRKLITLNLELLKPKKLHKLPRMQLEKLRKALLPGKRGPKMPRKKLPRKWPMMRKRPKRERRS
jgi:hypothetical protein